MGGGDERVLFMSNYVNVSNSWRAVKYTYVNVSGSWKQCLNIYANSSGWKPLYQYWWALGGWGACSASCGGGWQYRTVTCYRSHSTNGGLDQLSMDDSYCTRTVGGKPATQQQCNTHSCTECQYSVSSYNCSRIVRYCQYAFVRVRWYNDNEAGTNGTNYHYYWNSEALFGTSSDQASYIITNGYKYTHPDNYSYTCKSSDGNDTINYYQICRTPV